MWRLLVVCVILEGNDQRSILPFSVGMRTCCHHLGHENALTQYWKFMDKCMHLNVKPLFKGSIHSNHKKHLSHSFVSLGYADTSDIQLWNFCLHPNTAMCIPNSLVNRLHTVFTVLLFHRVAGCCLSDDFSPQSSSSVPSPQSSLPSQTCRRSTQPPRLHSFIPAGHSFPGSGTDDAMSENNIKIIAMIMLIMALQFWLIS